MTAATPRPWRTGIGRFGLGSLAAAAPGLLLAEVYPEGSGNRIFAERHEDAALIVRAVNAFDDLVAALRELVAQLSEYEAVWMTTHTGYTKVSRAKAEARTALRDLDAASQQEEAE